MANTFKFGNGNWAVKDGYALAYNDENNNFKPLPFDFTRASSATRVNKQGLVEVVPSGKPRIDFTDNTSGHLLLEPSRTNNLPYAEQFDNAAWSKGNSTVTANQAISPDGSQTADLLQLTSAGGNVFDGVGGSGDYAFSVFAKYVDAQFIRLRSTGSYAYFDIQNGSVGSTINVSSTKIEDYGNGWYRCTVVGNNTNSLAQIFVSDTDGSNTGTGSVYIWGAMFEAGSYATSYIPTEGSSVTRVVETANGAGNDSIFSEAEGVLYVESEALANDETSRVIASISNGSSNLNRVVLQYTNNVGGNQVVAFAQTASGYSSVHTRSITNALTFNKFAVVYNDSTNNFDLWVNGTKLGDGSFNYSFTANALSKIQFADGNTTNNPFYGKIKDIKVYNTALTDTELQNLTS